jgi:hypothetical protein
MYFLMNDVVLSLELQVLTPPIMAQRFSALSLGCIERLGREIFAEEPKLQHRAVERARRLASLIVSKAPQINAALFVSPQRGCGPEQVAFRLASLDVPLLARLYHDQQQGRLNAALADELVWGRAAA